MSANPISTGRSRAFAIAALAAVAAAYLVSFALVNHQGLWINDNNLKFIQVRTIAQSHGRDFAVPWPGARLDPGHRFNPVPEPLGVVRDGKLYITYSAPFAALTALPYSAFGFGGLFVIPLISFFLLIPALWSLAGSLPAPRLGRPLAVILAGLATPLWFYSLTLWEHLPATALALGGLALLLRRPSSRINLIAAGLLTACSVWFRADMYLWAAAVMIVRFLQRDRRRFLITWTPAFIAGLLPLWALQQHWLGSPLGLHLTEHSPLAHGLGPFLADRLTMVYKLILANHQLTWVSALLAGPGLLLWLVRPALPPERFERAVPAAAAFGALSGAVILGAQLMADQPLWRLVTINGFFSGSYVLLPGLFRSRDGGVDKGGVVVLQRFSLIFAALYVLLSPPTSVGVHWGCRFLLPLYPLLAMLAASAVARVWEGKTGRFLTAAAMAAALIVSLAAQVYSLDLLHRERTLSEQLHREVSARPEQVLVSGDWFVPEILGRDFFDKAIFRLYRPGDRAALTGILKSAGVKRVLVVSSLPPGQTPSPEATVIDDGLNFIRLQIVSAPTERLGD